MSNCLSGQSEYSTPHQQGPLHITLADDNVNGEANSTPCGGVPPSSETSTKNDS